MKPQIKRDIYTRKAIFSDELHKFCMFAKENDFIEISQWKNGEGVDILIDTHLTHEKKFSFTYGEYTLIKKMMKMLDDDNFNE